MADDEKVKAERSPLWDWLSLAGRLAAVVWLVFLAVGFAGFVRDKLTEGMAPDPALPPAAAPLAASQLTAAPLAASQLAAAPLAAATVAPLQPPANVPPTSQPPPTPLPPPSPTPFPTFTTTLTPFVVTVAAPPQDVFAAATVVARATLDAETLGTATPTPVNAITATWTPRPWVVTATPAPVNAITRAAATAAAFTTGTPTALPAHAVTATPSPRPTETPVLVYLSDLPTAPPGASPTPTRPAIPPGLTGQILFLSDMGGAEHAYALDPATGRLGRLTDRWPYDAAAQREPFAADGIRRAFSQRDGNGRVQVWYHDAQYGVVRQLTWFGAGAAWAPAWSPDGERVALVSNESGNDEIWVATIGERDPLQLTHNTWEWDQHPSWSPDGQTLVFMTNRTGQRQLWLMRPDGGDARPLTDSRFAAWDPVWVK